MMNAVYFILQPDGTQTGPLLHAQVVANLTKGVLRRESLVRRADLAEFFAVDSYPEFAQAAVSAPKVVAAAARPGKARVVAPEVSSGSKVMVWVMVAILFAMAGYGVKLGWDKWRAGTEKEHELAAERWRKENLPEYRIVELRKRLGKITATDAEIVVEGEVEEKEAKRHAEHGRAEREEVFVRLFFANDLTGPMSLIQLPTERVKIRGGKGNFTVIQVISDADVMARLLSLWDRIKVEGRIQYEK